MSGLDEENIRMLFVSLMKNCRFNFKKISRDLGVSYVRVKRVIDKLVEGGFITVKPLISARSIGSTGAVVRFHKVNGEVLSVLTKCNRVLGFIDTGSEVVALICGVDKQDIVDFISKLAYTVGGEIDFTIEFGRFSLTQFIPMKSVDEEGCLHNGALCGRCVVLQSLSNGGKRRRTLFNHHSIEPAFRKV